MIEPTIKPNDRVLADPAGCFCLEEEEPLLKLINVHRGEGSVNDGARLGLIFPKLEPLGECEVGS
jgi:hypothetical protein